MTKRPPPARRSRSVPANAPADEADASGEPPTFCPLFPEVPTSKVGKVVVQRVYEDANGDEKRAHIVGPKVNAELSIETLKAIAGGGDFEVYFFERERPGKILCRRSLELEGPPRDFDDDDDEEDDGDPVDMKPTVIPVPGESPIVMPGGLSGPEQAAFMAREQERRSQQKEVEAARKAMADGGGGMSSVIAAAMSNSTQMLTAILSKPTSDPAMQAMVTTLQSQLSAANSEKAALITQHGMQLQTLMQNHAAEIAAMRGEHNAQRAADREEISKLRDEVRRVTGLAETNVATARLEADYAALPEGAKQALLLPLLLGVDGLSGSA